MPTYCTAQDVLQYLMVDLDNTNAAITTDKIDNIINLKEDYLDAELAHAYRKTKITEEYHDITDGYRYGLGMRVPLYHRKIHEFDTAEGDKVEYRRTNTWETISDFVVDKTPGIIYFRNLTFVTSLNNAVRISYHYGDTVVPGWVKEVCILLTAIHILQIAWQKIPVSFDDINTVRDTITQWQDTVQNIIESHKEFIVG